MMGKGQLHLQTEYLASESVKIIDFLNTQKELSSLSKEQLKKVIKLGGVWLTTQSKTKKNTPRRVRRNDIELRSGDKVEAYIDLDLLGEKGDYFKERLEGVQQLFTQRSGYGCYYKPSSVHVQGTRFGDLYSMEGFFRRRKQEVHLVHRLDFETMGLILLAFNKRMAKFLSQLFSERKIEKYYLARVVKENRAKNYPLGEWQRIEKPLEDKMCITEFFFITEDLVLVRLITGKRHQIRKHLSSLSYPILGDPLYGRKNKSEYGLQLAAYYLSFKDDLEKNRLYIAPWELLEETFRIEREEKELVRKAINSCSKAD